MLASLFSFIALATIQAGKAPWPQVQKDSEHSRRGDAAWPRSSQVSLQSLIGFPLNTPVLIGPGDILYGGSLDGNIYAVTKTGKVLWTLYLSGGDCGNGFFLNDFFSPPRLYCSSTGNGRLQVVDVTLSPPNITSDTLLPPSSLMAMGESVFVLLGNNLTCWSPMFLPTLLWTAPINSQYALEDAVIHKSNLIVLQSTSFAGSYNFLSAYDLFSGYELWNDTFSADSGGRLIISGDTVIAKLNDEESTNLKAYDYITGDMLWSLSDLTIDARLSVAQNGDVITSKYSINATNGDLTPLPIHPTSLLFYSQIIDTSGSLFLLCDVVSTLSTSFLYGFDIQSGENLFSPIFLSEGAEMNLGLAMASDGTLFLSSQAAGIYFIATTLPPSPSPNASISSSASTTLSLSPSTHPTHPVPPPASSPPSPSGLVTAGWASLGSVLGVLAGGSLVYLYLRGHTISSPSHLQAQLAGGDYISVQ